MLLPVFLTLTPAHILTGFGVLGGCYAVFEGIFNLSSWHVRRLGKADDAFDKRIPSLERSVEILVTDVGVMKGTLSSIEATLSSMLNIQTIQTGILIAIVATIICVIVIVGLLIFAAAAFFWWNKRQAPQTQNAPHGGGGGIGGGGGADIGGWTQSQLVQAMVQAMNAPNEPFAAGAHTPLASPLPTAAAAAWGTPLQSPPAAEHAAAAAPAPAPAPAPA